MAAANVNTRRWTVEEYQNLSRMGVFRPDERLELIDGEIMEQMTPQLSRHATGVSLTQKELERAFPVGHVVRVQQPLDLNPFSQPEPDLAVVPGAIRDFAAAHPSSAVLVVEVSDTTLSFDRTTKAGIYARAGIDEYWILNLAERRLEVHRHPAPMPERLLGHYFTAVTRHSEADSLAPLAAPDCVIPVSALLP